MTFSDSVPNRVVIVGSGPAGVAIAEELTDRGVHVLILTGGLTVQTERNRNFNSGAAPKGVWGHEDLRENRRRMVGGTSTAWGGRCVLLDPIDFETRSWIRNSGWPISHDEYLKWLAPAAKKLKIEPPVFRRNLTGGLFSGGLAEDQLEITSDGLELWSPPVDFGSTVADKLLRSPYCEIINDSQLVEMRFGADDEVSELVVASAHGRSVIRGQEIVLAMGALENARMLLASKIASSLPALGRYYMSHTFTSLLRIDGPPLSKEAAFFRTNGVYKRNRWQLSESAQRKYEIGNAIGFIARPPSSSAAIHQDPLSSAISLAKIVSNSISLSPRVSIKAITERQGDFAHHLKVLRHADLTFWGRAASLAVQRFTGRRLPIVLPDFRAERKFLTFQGEHMPDEQSRVFLTKKRDEFGIPLLATNIEFNRGDFETVRQFHEVFTDLAIKRGHSPLNDASWVVRQLASGMYKNFNSNAHHLGTTRMGSSIHTSVVDKNLKVHGVKNLYVAGSSVFPTSGHANPTLSIVMLSIRLADHLARRMKL